MTRPTDEELMAYADGALSAADQARVEAHLATDAEARALVAMYRTTATAARDAFSIPRDEAPPKFLIDTILGHGGQARGAEVRSRDEGGSATVVELKSHRRPRRLSENLRLPLAASLALVVGLGAGYLANSRSVGQTEQIALGAVARTAPLADVLERRASGSTTGRHVVVATFRDKQDRPCRELELLGTSQPARAEVAGVACRSGDGTWTVEGAARLAAPAPARPGIEPSGIVERDALDGFLNMLGAKPVLSPSEERALIERGWK